MVDPATGEGKKKHAFVALGRIGDLKRWKAKEKLRGIIAEELGPRQIEQRPDPKTTFAWFVENRYLPVREGRWRPATKNNTGYEITLKSQHTFKLDSRGNHDWPVKPTNRQLVSGTRS